MTTTERSDVATRAQTELRSAWDQLIADLARARDAIDDPELYPPPLLGDRVVAEGYRYLLGFLFGAIERSFMDPLYPYFRRAIQPMDKATIDNADAVYLCASIDGEHTYRVAGRPPAREGRKPPLYLIFEATTFYAGDSGELSELTPGLRVNTGTIDSSSISYAPDGSFEILLGPRRPDGHEGDFIATKQTRTYGDEEVEHTAYHLVLRELFSDWEHEEPMEIEIARLDSVGNQPEALTSERAAESIKRTGEITRNQMRFWNEFYTVLLETHADMNGDGERFMPRNAFNDPSPAGIATGGGQSTNVYAGGVFELGADDALIIEVTTPMEPQYMGFHIGNLWGESADYANHQSSLNGSQAEPDADGHLRYVIAHTDPGVPNWIDTTGLPEGFMTQRWTYSEQPEELPMISAKKVALADVRKELPTDTRSVTPDERRETIRIRQQHVQRRYRQY